MSLLHIDQLNLYYGGIHALKNLSLRVEPGEFVALIGANGAGKTSCLKAISGLLPSTGQLRYQQQDLQQLPPYQRPQQGLVLVPEGRGIFADLSVEENLLLGAYHRKDQQIAQDLQQGYQQFSRLFERRHQAAGTLSGGEQQLLALARALMARPKLLLLDEPSMGLAPIMVQQIFACLKQIHQSGISLLLVEQNAQLALSLSQRAYVLEQGRVCLSGPSAELLKNPEVQAAYLGA